MAIVDEAPAARAVLLAVERDLDGNVLVFSGMATQANDVFEDQCDDYALSGSTEPFPTSTQQAKQQSQMYDLIHPVHGLVAE